MSQSKAFPLEPILTFHFRIAGYSDQVPELVEFMTGRSDQLPIQYLANTKACRIAIAAQMPWLQTITVDGVKPVEYQQWLAEQVAKHGNWHNVQPLPLPTRIRLDIVIAFHTTLWRLRMLVSQFHRR